MGQPTSTKINWAIGVTTAPRASATLERCLESLATAGWDDVRIFAEPGSTIPPRFSQLTRTRRDERIGAWPNWYLGLSELFVRNPHADAFMLVQDDAVFCSNVRMLLESIVWPTPPPAIISPYCPASIERPTPGFHQVKADWTLTGALAYVLPRDSAELLLSHRPLIRYRRDGLGGGVKHIDAALGSWARDIGRPVFYFSPSLVEHIGTTSTIDKTKTLTEARRAKSFVGQSFDALTFASKGVVADESSAMTEDLPSTSFRAYPLLGHVWEARVNSIVPTADRPPFHDKSISSYCSCVLQTMIHSGMRTLECGSGLSTLLFEAAGCIHTALEHDTQYCPPSSKVILAPLVGSPPWYRWEPDQEYDLVYIDGPNEHAERAGILRTLAACIHRSSIIVVADTHFAPERELVQRISGIHDSTLYRFGGYGREFTVLMPRVEV